MRHLLVPICLTAFLGLAACDGDNAVRISSSSSENDNGGPLKVIDALQCPQVMGDLTRKGSAQAGGSICTYSGPRGAEVSLHLVTLGDGTVDEALAQFENQLSADMPRARAAIEAQPTVPTTPPSPARPGEQAEEVNVRLPGMSVDAEGDKATVRMPGVSIDADGDKASVRIGGFSIDADDGSQEVNITSDNNSVSIEANDEGAEIRTRAPGSATRATWLLTHEGAEAGTWRLVGYEARGPSGGPIVVATIRARDDQQDGLFDAAKDLVTLNVGE